jgi:thiamine-phosphate pyrophosphorylase
MIRPVAGAAVIALRGDEVLLVRRAKEPRQGDWSPPGGSIEPGETARLAAAREALEETGLRLIVRDVVDVFDAIIPAADGRPGFHYCVADFLAEPEDPLAKPLPGDDALDARWVPFSEVEALGVSAAVRTVLERATWLRRQRRPPALGEAPAILSPPLTARWGRYLAGSLYAITDDRGPSRDHLAVAEAALAGGARIIQLRDKRRDGGDLLDLARAITDRARRAGALFLINDRVDVAAAAGADGVHLGQTDLPVGAARAILGPSACVGISVESPEQARQAEDEGADYVGVGAIFGSHTKADAGEAVGLEHLRLVRAATRLPIVAIGGITAERVDAVIAAGADTVAVISAISATPDMRAAAEELVDRARRAWEADSDPPREG